MMDIKFQRYCAAASKSMDLMNIVNFNKLAYFGDLVNRKSSQNIRKQLIKRFFNFCTFSDIIDHSSTMQEPEQERQQLKMFLQGLERRLSNQVCLLSL